MSSAYSKFHDQCSDGIWLKLTAVPPFVAIKKNSNLLGLMELLEGIILDFKGHANPYFPLYNINRKMALFRQDQSWALDEYGKKFKAIQCTVEKFRDPTAPTRVQRILNDAD